MSDKAVRVRVSLILTKAYVDALDRLVEMGVYLEHQVAIREALRRLFQFYRIEPFTDNGAEPEADAPSEQ